MDVKKNEKKRVVNPKPQSKKGLFKTRAFRSGGYSTLISVVVVALIVALNLFVSQIPTTYTKIDTTPEQLFTLGEQTKEIVSAIDQDVTLMLVAQSGNEDSTVMELLNRYAALNDRVHVKTLDPVVYPKSLEKYQSASLSENSVIVESDLRYSVVGNSEIYVYDYSSYYYTGSYDVSFAGESAITSAIDSVTSENLPVLYALEGHGEAEMASWLSEAVSKENMQVQSLSLLSKDAVPADADGLLIYAPTSDLSAEESDKIIAYMEAGGKLMLITDYLDTQMPNLLRIAENYGVTAQKGIVVEQDMNYCLRGYTHYLLPEIQTHEITDPLTQGRLYALMPLSHGIAKLDAYRSSLQIAELLTTTGSAYSKLDPYGAQTLEKEDGDVDGPFAVAVAVTETLDAGETRFVWFSTSQFLDQAVNQMVSGGNQDLFLNALNWMCERENNIAIRSKSLTASYLTIPSGEASIIRAVITVLLPLCVMAIGVSVCLRRRKR